MSNIFTHLGNLPGSVLQRRKLDLGALWAEWRQSQREAEQYVRETNRYDPKMAGSRTGISLDRVEKHYETEKQLHDEQGY